MFVQRGRGRGRGGEARVRGGARALDLENRAVKSQTNAKTPQAIKALISQSLWQQNISHVTNIQQIKYFAEILEKDLIPEGHN